MNAKNYNGLMVLFDTWICYSDSVKRCAFKAVIFKDVK